MSPIKFVTETTTPLYREPTGSQRSASLLWGDRVRVMESGAERCKAHARGQVGWVDADSLGDRPLLELYFIDVGQGDGVLIRTPDERHLLLDGGYRRSGQPTGKNAADFVDWKFAKDYEAGSIHLDAMIASHCDADHYGGLWDLVNPRERAGLDLDDVVVDAFYHAGVSWWIGPGSKRGLGSEEDGYLTQLLADRVAVGEALNGSGPQLQGEWADFLRDVYDAGCPIERLSASTDYLPGFGPDECEAVFEVLGPTEFDRGGHKALRSYGSTSKNTNGNSVVLRIDYGSVRILLTGDLNRAAQQALLEDYTGQRDVFACDVMKGCHHGSDDASYEFLNTVSAACTVISSGDNESYAHPRPTIVAASGRTGHPRIARDQVDTPLVYQTEVARSVRLGSVVEVLVDTLDEEGRPSTQSVSPDRVSVVFTETRAGDLRPRRGERSLASMKVVPGLIYGLVNVRTDGNKVLCATRNEKNGSWDVEEFISRF